jgi:uncharacterized protein (DUF427 family)
VLRYGCVVVADTDDLVRVLETSHPPTYYLPRQAFGNHLVPVERATVCEWKGVARYVDVVVAGASPLREVGWWYPRPDPRYPSLIDRVAVYRVRSRRSRWTVSAWWRSPAASYGGWITGDVVGPFKGEPGSWGW